MSRVDELKALADEVAREAIPTRACGTCRHTGRETGVFQKCAALGMYASTARIYTAYCGPNGRLWEPKPPRKRGVIERAWRWLFGGAP